MSSAPDAPTDEQTPTPRNHETTNANVVSLQEWRQQIAVENDVRHAIDLAHDVASQLGSLDGQPPLSTSHGLLAALLTHIPDLTEAAVVSTPRLLSPNVHD